MPRELSRHLRRNGGAVVDYSAMLDWFPKTVVQVGVGMNHPEVKYFREAWGDDFRLVGFEPCQRTVDRIAKVYPGELYPYAVSDFNGQATLHRPARHSDGASLCKVRSDDDKRVEVRTLNSLVRLIAPSESDVLLWIDCEGSELPVLLGASCLLKRTIMLNVELTTRTEKRALDWSNATEVHNLLNAHGFVRVATHTHRSCIGQADALYVHRDFLTEKDAGWMVWCPCQEKLLNDC